MNATDSKYIPKSYSNKEEALNVYSHGLGFVLSIVALVLLVLRAVRYGDVWHIISFSIYGVSMIVLYLASTLFHAARNPVRRRRLNIFDHASIFVLIAGTYTPYLLVTLNGAWGWSLFGVVWGIAIIGIVLKIFYTGRFRLASTIMYLLMGWVIIVAIKPLLQNLAPDGLWLLALGGLFYSVGAALYMIPKIPYNHAIFHLLVLLGSASHFLSIYYFVAPS